MTSPKQAAADKSGIFITVDQRSFDSALQISIGLRDANGGGHGYRIAGAKYDGAGKELLRRKLTERDVKEIRSYLRRVKKDKKYLEHSND